MENVQFEEGQEMRSVSQIRGQQVSAVTRLFIALHLGKNQKQANVFMIIITIICFALMFYFLHMALS